MPCIVIESGVWPPLSFIGPLVSQKTRLVERGVVRMGDLVSAIITLYLRLMSKLISPS